MLKTENLYKKNEILYMKIQPKLVDHSLFMPKPKPKIIPIQTEPFFTWKIIVNLIGFTILCLFSCVLYERYITKDKYENDKYSKINNTLTYIQEKIK